MQLLCFCVLKPFPCFVYRKQRKKLHDRLRQSLRSERNNVMNMANGPHHPNPPPDNVQLVNVGFTAHISALFASAIATAIYNVNSHFRLLNTVRFQGAVLLVMPTPVLHSSVTAMKGILHRVERVWQLLQQLKRKNW